MPTLAPKLPYTHPFAGGYPRLGGQLLPSDPDAIDYLARVAAADGAAVEVGVAMAVDAFIKGCKADGIWDAIKASCILCGARTISGALVPLVGPSPTAYPQPVNFVSADYDRSSGLKGDGSTKYLDSNRANDADGQNDKHVSVYSTAAPTLTGALIGSATTTPTISRTQMYHTFSSSTNFAVNSEAVLNSAASLAGTFAGVQIEGATMSCRVGGTTQQTSTTVVGHSPSTAVFARNLEGSPHLHTNARLAFYSIGSALDLAALDARVSTLVSAIAAAI